MSAAAFNDITLAELRAGLADDSIRLVDVREADEFASGHIEGAQFNPLSKFDAAKLPPPEPGRRIVVYCRSGRRSVTAMEQARLMGRGDVNTHFGGGILGWLAADLPTEKGG